MEITPKQIEAFSQAADILETESTQLVHYLEFTLKTELSIREKEIVRIADITPHRVAIAVRNELHRMRDIAQTLRSLIPPSTAHQDED